jgi:DNA-binding CsgD family transcriptional regulator
MNPIVYLDAWADQYEQLDPEPDYTAKVLPAHPDPDRRGVIVINHPVGTRSFLGFTIPSPSHAVTVQGTQSVWTQSVWWLGWPVSRDQAREWNTWAHVANALAFHLGGMIADQLVNLDALEAEGLVEYDLRIDKTTHYLGDLRDYLRERNLWTRQATFPREVRQKAGQMTTDAQTAARRRNSATARQAARATNRAKGEARAREILALVEAGLSEEEMAKRLGISSVSVRPAISKARQRLGVLAPAAIDARAVAPAVEAEDRVGLEELGELLSADEDADGAARPGGAEPSNVPQPRREHYAVAPNRGRRQTYAAREEIIQKRFAATSKMRIAEINKRNAALPQ